MDGALEQRLLGREKQPDLKQQQGDPGDESERLDGLDPCSLRARLFGFSLCGRDLPSAMRFSSFSTS